MTKALQENIKRQLHAKNMTAAELERRTGIPHAVVNILHGRSKNPSIKTAQAIAKELGCSVEELLADEVTSHLNDASKDCNEHKDIWSQQLYVAVFKVVNEQIHKLKLQPTPEKVGQWLTEVYKYSLSSPDLAVDQRFVQWLLERDQASSK